VIDHSVPPDLTFRFPAGRPSVDLTATLRRSERRPALERLRAAEDLPRWFAAAGLTAGQVAARERDLDAARELREALYRVFQRHRSGQAIDARDVALVNGWAAKPPPVERLTLDADGRLAAAGEANTAAALLALVARDAVELLTGPLRDRIRECEGSGCTTLFVDASRGGRRRWCSMDVCGARSKMAAYRGRRADKVG
jgi:predicted RNA-binding Zn ribbon-like protein